MLRVELISGEELEISDVLSASSDPFCVFTFNNQMYESQVILKNLNPQWNEAYDMFVPDDENLEQEEKVKVNEREEKQPRLRGHLKIKPTDEVG